MQVAAPGHRGRSSIRWPKGSISRRSTTCFAPPGLSRCSTPRRQDIEIFIHTGPGHPGPVVRHADRRDGLRLRRVRFVRDACATSRPCGNRQIGALHRLEQTAADEAPTRMMRSPTSPICGLSTKRSPNSSNARDVQRGSRKKLPPSRSPRSTSLIRACLEAPQAAHDKQALPRPARLHRGVARAAKPRPAISRVAAF